MAINVAHTVNPEVLGETARQAAKANAVRENTIRSLEAAQQQNQFNQKIGQANRQRALDAYQFDVSHENNAALRLAQLYGEADQRAKAWQQVQLQQANQEKAQANYDADNQLKREQFGYQQQADAQQRQDAQGRFERTQGVHEFDAVQNVDAGMKQRMTAAASVELNPEGKKAYSDWLSKYRTLQKLYRDGEMRPMQYAQNAQKMAAEYDSLGLDLHMVKTPTPEEEFKKDAVPLPTGGFLVRERGAHGVTWKEVGLPTSAPTKQPRPFRAADVYSAENSGELDRHYKLAQQRLIEQRTRERILNGPKDESGAPLMSWGEAEAKVDYPSPEAVYDEMRNYLLQREREAAHVFRHGFSSPAQPPAMPEPRRAPPPVTRLPKGMSLSNAQNLASGEQQTGEVHTNPAAFNQDGRQADENGNLIDTPAMTPPTRDETQPQSKTVPIIPPDATPIERYAAGRGREIVRHQAATGDVAKDLREAILRERERQAIHGAESRGAFRWMTDRLPFVGSALNAADLASVRSAAQRIQSGDYTIEDVHKLAWAVVDEETAAQAERDKGLPEQVIDAVTSIPGYGLEYQATRGAAKKLLGMGADALKRSLVNKFGREAAIIGTQTMLNVPRLAEGTLRRAAPQVSPAISAPASDGPEQYPPQFDESAPQGSLANPLVLDGMEGIDGLPPGVHVIVGDHVYVTE